ncbi:NAD(P)/FAD-dependent oxidoreductase [Cohaesibacter intestini]|uniref:NAD(P)/FAD-dependent oxidoreductase n=1 Tax=Cohaesibacter intestini TaxID=2211145 RepID=UPI001FDFAD03|nr:FAD/NAD(P)-binding oxidoreductase [Cohaesibacter intestini]
MSQMLKALTRPSRRDLLKFTAGSGLLLTAAAAASNSKAQTKTKAHIVIAGAGAAGLAAANRLAARLDGVKITLIDGRKRHLYQPGFTLIAAGLKPANYSVSSTREWMPSGAELIEEAVAEFDPEGNKVITQSGKAIAYDYLLVTTGLMLDFDAIEGFEKSLIGKDGIGAVYAGPEEAEATWREMDRFTDTGGVGLFYRPATGMKCAGAPLKYTFLTDDRARRKGTRGKIEVHYAAHNNGFFGVPIVNEKLRMLFADRGVKPVFNHVLKAIDPGKKICTFATPDGDKDMPYDFTNVIPPMRAPDAVLNSPLPIHPGDMAKGGWVDVDKYNLRHNRFKNVWAVGDVAGVPKGKTAASVKWQVPVAVDHIIADIEGKTSDEVYNGYTSCPLITKIGRAMLIEFDYNNNLVPSFPGVIAPLEELWISWLMKEIALKATYLAMVRGRA